MVRWLTGLQPFGALCMRLVLGVAMFVHGWAKVAPLGGLHGHDLPSGINHFAHYVTTLGLPHWLDGVVREQSGQPILHQPDPSSCQWNTCGPRHLC